MNTHKEKSTLKISIYIYKSLDNNKPYSYSLKNKTIISFVWTLHLKVFINKELSRNKF